MEVALLVVVWCELAPEEPSVFSFLRFLTEASSAQSECHFWYIEGVTFSP